MFARFCLICLLGIPLVSLSAGDIDRGRQKAQLCLGCHAVGGYQVTYPIVYHVPRLSGQHQAYLQEALSQYRSGQRRFDTMNAAASDLSDQDIEDLAAYFSNGMPEN